MILIVSFSFSAAFSQDAVNGTVNNTAVTTGNQESNTGENSANITEKKIENQNTSISGVGEKKNIAEKKQRADTSKKTDRVSGNTDKKISETAKSVDGNNSGDELLLFINEGNYKYKRIPDIKLAEKEPSMAEQNQQGNSNAPSVDLQKPGDKGFFGLSKNTSDIVAKGGILLLILIVFTIYKVRSRGHGRRSSSSVMNSYRK